MNYSDDEVIDRHYFDQNDDLLPKERKKLHESYVKERKEKASSRSQRKNDAFSKRNPELK